MKNKYYLYSIEFWKAALHRALRTFFQALSGSSLAGLVIWEVNWKYILGGSIVSAILSLAMAAATGLPELEEEYEEE